MTIARAAAATLFALALAGSSGPRTICRNGTGTRGGLFHSFWHAGGTGCMTLGADGRFAVTWTLASDGNLVAGRGWRRGSLTRRIGYRVRDFDPGSNGYISLYGWSRAPLVEYYVVDDWGGFVPPGGDAQPLGTLTSDGGTYRIYRTRRVQQPSIAGTATFDQYWSVRTERRTTAANAITFANHVSAWRRAGMKLGRLDYQVLAVEGFGSSGHADVTVRGR